jgi:chemosensory pili system protein ChpA (sensor histidine kinase/response regulator)
MELVQVDVLIVDDDAGIRRLLRTALQRLGLVCTEARDGIEALACLQTVNPAVILLDLMMPRLDGYAVAEQFNASRIREQRPVIFALSAGGDDELRRTKADAVHAIVRKPFDVNELAEIVALCVATRWALVLSATMSGRDTPKVAITS